MTVGCISVISRIKLKSWINKNLILIQTLPPKSYLVGPLIWVSLNSSKCVLLLKKRSLAFQHIARLNLDFLCSSVYCNDSICYNTAIWYTNVTVSFPRRLGNLRQANSLLYLSVWNIEIAIQEAPQSTLQRFWGRSITVPDIDVTIVQTIISGLITLVYIYLMRGLSDSALDVCKVVNKIIDLKQAEAQRKHDYRAIEAFSNLILLMKVIRSVASLADSDTDAERTESITIFLEVQDELRAVTDNKCTHGDFVLSRDSIDGEIECLLCIRILSIRCFLCGT